MLAKIYSAAIVGVESKLVEVEVDVQLSGLPGWSMVGLLETAVKEARDRVASAIRNSGYKLVNRKTVVNLAPGHLKKSGVHFDLAIAIGMLTAWGICIPSTKKRYLFAGELSLTGRLLPITGTLLMTLAARDHALDGIIIPRENVDEACLVSNIDVIGMPTLAAAVTFLNDGTLPNPVQRSHKSSKPPPTLDFADVRGQPAVKRGLEIAAAGGHNVLMVGPPGSGKTMLAERLPSILPPLTADEKLETMKVLSIHGLLTELHSIGDERPFRAPHHSGSYAGLIGGGGGVPRLGEISLAHHGVLFLDEIAEFHRDVLEVLRQPIESGIVRIARSGGSVTYPARFMLVAAMNPCRCGYYGHPRRPCVCTIPQIEAYRRKISGPLLDRIDIALEVEPVAHDALLGDAIGEASADIRSRVIAARKHQLHRLGSPIVCNARICASDVKKFCSTKGTTHALLERAVEKMSLSARAVHRTLKLARTIADLENAPEIGAPHLAEALQYRPCDSQTGSS